MADSQLDSILSALSDAEAFPHPAPAIEVVHTHASAVILAGEHVYKLKKPVDFGFLDYSTLEKRRAMCTAEVELNRRLAPGVYLGVVPITLEAGRITLGGGGEPIEYAVHMRRLAEQATLAALVERGPLAPALVEELGRRIARFHAEARGGPEIARWASFERVRTNCRDNLTYLEQLAGVLAPQVELLRLSIALEAELESQRARIEARAAAGVARETHGDLRLEHVYALAPGELAIVDCIEFAERYRHADPVSDIAFLAMDLESRGAWRESARLLEAYFAESRDEDGRALVPLYLAYRSTVRAKVRAMQALGPEVPLPARERALQLARAHVQLAVGDLSQPGERPCLVLVGGLPGTGKSVLARGLSRSGRFSWLRADAVRKELAGMDPSSSGQAAIRAGIYTPEWNEHTYGECLVRAKNLLFAGRRVLVDASFKERRRRESFLDAARDWGVPAHILVCTSPAEVARERLGARRGDPSDANWTVYEHVRDTWEPLGERESGLCSPIATIGSVEETLELALEALRGARLAGPRR